MTVFRGIKGIFWIGFWSKIPLIPHLIYLIKGKKVPKILKISLNSLFPNSPKLKVNRLPEFCIRHGSLNVDNLNPNFCEVFSEKPFSDELEVHTNSVA